MTALVLGLLLFLGAHSVRIVAEPWRQAQIARLGDKPWKLGYTAISLLGFGLILWGYAQARLTPTVLWATPRGMNHLAALLTLLAFILLAASNGPRNHIKARLRHPMVLAVKLWAFSHLLANNTLADVILFGSFLFWAVLSFRAARQRDRAGAPAPAAGTMTGTVGTVLVGIAAWAAFAFWIHGAWLGVRPLGAMAGS
jgi:uncharacterized membrane protein